VHCTRNRPVDLDLPISGFLVATVVNDDQRRHPLDEAAVQHVTRLAQYDWTSEAVWMSL